MKALVTGGTGFIGSEVVRQLLDAGDSVRIFSRRKDIAALSEKNVEVASGDFEHPQSLIDALDKIDVLYHIGEIKNVSKAASKKNVQLLEETLRQIQGKSVNRIVFVSSITVSGIPSAIPADEDTPPKTTLNDHFTDCKRRSEKLLMSSTGQISCTVIRPALVYGPGSHSLGRLIGILDKIGPFGLPFPGNAENLAPLIHVSDLAAAIARAGREPAAAGRIFNITDGLRHTWHEFLLSVSERLRRKLHIFPLPALLLQFAALPLDLLSGFLGISLDPVNYVTYFSEDIYFSNTRAKDLLNWQPRYSLAEGVNEMVDFYEKGK